MSAIRTWSRSHREEAALSAFVAGNVIAMFAEAQYETVPFHFVWISFSIVYVRRAWRPRFMAPALLAVTVVTGAGIVAGIRAGDVDYQEIAEVPLMAALFLATALQTEQLRRTSLRMRALVTEELGRRERDVDLVRDMSHELKTRITVARGHAELLNSSSTPARMAQEAMVVLRELNRLTEVTNQLSQLDRFRTTELSELSEIDVGELLVEAAERWSSVAHRIWSVSARGPMLILADRERITAALDALIENAVDFTEQSDRVTLAYTAEESSAVISVTDSGTGIARDDVAHVFDRFFSSNREGRRPGSGLGLAIVKTVVDAHGGEALVESIEGAGSRFVLRLPHSVEVSTAVPAGLSYVPVPAQRRDSELRDDDVESTGTPVNTEVRALGDS